MSRFFSSAPGSAVRSRNEAPMPDDEQIRRIIRDFVITDKDSDVTAVLDQSHPTKTKRVGRGPFAASKSSSQTYEGYSTLITSVANLSASPVNVNKQIEIKLNQLIPQAVIDSMAAMGAYQFTIEDLNIIQVLTPNFANVSGLLETNIQYVDEMVRYVQDVKAEQSVDLLVEVAPLPVTVEPSTVIGRCAFKLYDGQIVASSKDLCAESNQLKVYQFMTVRAQFDLNITAFSTKPIVDGKRNDSDRSMTPTNN